MRGMGLRRCKSGLKRVPRMALVQRDLPDVSALGRNSRFSFRAVKPIQSSELTLKPFGKNDRTKASSHRNDNPPGCSDFANVGWRMMPLFLHGSSQWAL